jgi:hypothetical protein
MEQLLARIPKMPHMDGNYTSASKVFGMARRFDGDTFAVIITVNAAS